MLLCSLPVVANSAHLLYLSSTSNATTSHSSSKVHPVLSGVPLLSLVQSCPSHHSLLWTTVTAPHHFHFCNLHGAAKVISTNTWVYYIISWLTALQGAFALKVPALTDGSSPNIHPRRPFQWLTLHHGPDTLEVLCLLKC